MKKFLELLFLKQLKGIGNSTINKKYVSLLKQTETFDEFVEVVYENEAKLTSTDIEKARNIANEKYNKIVNMTDITVITVFDEKYPTQLSGLKDKKPVILYAKGNVDILSFGGIAVVGTREPSIWSQKVEERLVAKILDISDKVIISGLALGCDKIAHETTVQAKGKTIAVLPSGVNVITPASHKALAKEILQNDGCLVSEYEPDAKVSKSTYVERDAIVAALSQAVMVVECGIKSGTMHTVNAAVEMSRTLACYYINDKEKGSYDGNAYMLSEKGAMQVSNNDELQILLDKLNVGTIAETEVKQLTFFDINNPDS